MVLETDRIDDLSTAACDRLFERFRVTDRREGDDTLSFDRFEVDFAVGDAFVPVGYFKEAYGVMDTLDDRRMLIIFADGVADTLAVAFFCLVDFGQEADIGTIKVRERFAKGAARQDVVVAEAVGCRVDEYDVKIAVEFPVLITIV